MNAVSFRNKIDPAGIVEFASELIRLPAVRGTSETPAAELVASYLTPRGYEVQLQEPLPGRKQVVAKLRGTGGGRSLMFNGHLDIDPLRADWKRDPWQPREEDGLLYGAGARNMKGGVASMIMAAEAIRQSGIELAGDLWLACVMGELEGGIGTTFLVESGVRTDAAILPEPLGAANIVTSMPGVYEAEVTVHGFSEHVNRRFLHIEGEDSTPVDAIEGMRKLLDFLETFAWQMEASALFPDLPFHHVGALTAGRGEGHDLRSTSYVADRSSAVVHLCFPERYTLADAESVLQKALTQFNEVEPAYRTIIHDHVDSELFQCRLVRVEPGIVPNDVEIVDVIRQSYGELTGRELDTVGVALPQTYTAGDHEILWRGAGIPAVYYGPSSPVRLRGDSDDCVSVSEMHTVSSILAASAVTWCG